MYTYSLLIWHATISTPIEQYEMLVYLKGGGGGGGGGGGNMNFLA